MNNPYLTVLDQKASGQTPAQLRIRGTMLQMLRDQTPDRIEVRELCRRAHTGRSTFYLYYSNISDVLTDIMHVPVQALVSSVDSRNSSSLEFIRQVWKALSDNEELIRVLVFGRKSADFLQQLDLGIKYLLWERLYGGRSGEYPEAELVVIMNSTALLRAFFYALEQADTDSSSSLCCEAVAGTLDAIEHRISSASIKCRVLKTGTTD